MPFDAHEERASTRSAYQDLQPQRHAREQRHGEGEQSGERRLLLFLARESYVEHRPRVAVFAKHLTQVQRPS